jgi:hypothetical protein
MRDSFELVFVAGAGTERAAVISLLTGDWMTKLQQDYGLSFQQTVKIIADMTTAIHERPYPRMPDKF